jgi:hypothetical protein
MGDTTPGAGGTPEADPPGGRGMRVPPWAAVAAAGVIVLIIVVVAVALTRGGDDGADEPPGPVTTAATTTDRTPVTDRLEPLPSAEDFAAAIAPVMDRLDPSAAAVAAALATAGDPGGIARVRAAATRQQQVVAQARARLAQIPTPPAADQARAREALAGASADHILYLRRLAQATAGTPTRARVEVLNRARAAAAQALAGYREFFSLAPAVPDRITGSGLGNTAPTRSAMLAAIAAAESAREGRGDIIPDESASSSGFQSPTGNLRCGLRGSELVCGSLNDDFLVILPESGGAVSTRGTPDGGPVLAYGSSWSRGAFTCRSETNGISCENATGNGFFLSRESFYQW